MEQNYIIWENECQNGDATISINGTPRNPPITAEQLIHSIVEESKDSKSSGSISFESVIGCIPACINYSIGEMSIIQTDIFKKYKNVHVESVYYNGGWGLNRYIIKLVEEELIESDIAQAFKDGDQQAKKEADLRAIKVDDLRMDKEILESKIGSLIATFSDQYKGININRVDIELIKVKEQDAQMPNVYCASVNVVITL